MKITERQKLIMELALEEAKKLKKLLTKEEKSKLCFKTLDDDSPYKCIYGQTTGNCFSERAQKLIKKSCVRVFNGGKGTIKASVNGAPEGPRGDFYSKVNYWSPIEVFISQPRNKNNENNKILLEYLKGERKTLEFF